MDEGSQGTGGPGEPGAGTPDMHERHSSEPSKDADPPHPLSFAEAAEALEADLVSGTPAEALDARARALSERSFARRREHGVTASPQQPAAVTEFHVCAGLNACAGHDVTGGGLIAGAGECATSQHVCHGSGACRGQGGCGYAGSAYEQAIPGEQSCSHHGSCASPINRCRVSSIGPNKGKSVWKLARKLFEARMFNAQVQFQPVSLEGFPDDRVPSYVKSVPGVDVGCAPDAPGSLCRTPHPDHLDHDPGADPNLCRATKPGA